MTNVHTTTEKTEIVCRTCKLLASGGEPLATIYRDMIKESTMTKTITSELKLPKIPIFDNQDKLT
jgi:hypothetical protein